MNFSKIKNPIELIRTAAGTSLSIKKREAANSNSHQTKCLTRSWTEILIWVLGDACKKLGIVEIMGTDHTTLYNLAYQDNKRPVHLTSYVSRSDLVNQILI